MSLVGGGSLVSCNDSYTIGFELVRSSSDGLRELGGISRLG